MHSDESTDGSRYRPVSVQPEILPPLEDDARQRTPLREPMVPQAAGVARARGRWAIAPATYVLVGINCAVFLLMSLSGVSTVAPRAIDLVHWGANWGTAVLEGQWWRLLTATFVHVGIIHLATNMWCLWNLGLLGEPLLGPVGMVAVYVLTGIAGNLLSTAVHPQIVGAGASGAVFGLAGVLILLLRSKLLPVDPFELKRLRQSVIYFALLNFAIGAGTWLFRSGLQIDNMAHLGGFLSGLAVGLPLVPRIGARKPQFVTRQWVAFGGLATLLVLFGFGVVSFWR